MPGRPSERDGAAPVVGHDHDRAAQLELLGERAEIVDALLQPTRAPGALGEAHLELVDRHDADPGAGAGEHVSPRERPRRVAVHAQQGDRRVGHLVVEDVPSAPHGVELRRDDQPRPRRVEADDAGRRQGRGCGGSAGARASLVVPLEPDSLRHGQIVCVTVRRVDFQENHQYDAAPDVVFAMLTDPEFLPRGSSRRERSTTTSSSASRRPRAAIASSRRAPCRPTFLPSRRSSSSRRRR